MKQLVVDIETDDLLANLSRMWVLCTRDIDTGEKRHWGPNDGLGWQDHLADADVLIGHNIIGFDFAALNKLYGWRPAERTAVIDTLIMSKWLNYRRFGMAGHSLARWGELLGYPKIEFSDWTQYSEEMLVYCEGDCELCSRVYAVLAAEFGRVSKHNQYAKALLRAEHDAAQWAADAEVLGWPFDRDAAAELYMKIEERVTEISDKLEPMLGLKTIPVDMKGGEVEVKEPVITKRGLYAKYIAEWFGINPVDALLPGFDIVAGPYCRVKFEPRKLSSVQDVKDWLFGVGWHPTEWNTKFDPELKKTVKTSAKITADSLEFLQGDGEMYSEYLMLKSRRDIIRGWLSNCTFDGNCFRVHGTSNVIGTPSMRATHNIIVNVPRVTSKYGSEMRSLFRSLDGWVQIGADSTSNQLRGLCYYLGDEDYTKLVMTGDVHTYHENIVNDIIQQLLNMPPSCTRDDAKRLIYALLFGCGDLKTALYTIHRPDEDAGKIIKSSFLTRVAGIDSLLRRLKAESKRNVFNGYLEGRRTGAYGYHYLNGLGGNRLYTNDSNTHLCYLLQAFEKATTSTAISWLRKALRDEGIPYVPLIYMHDEVQFMTPEMYADRARELGALAFKEGPKLAGVDIMDGVAKVGRNWKDCH